MRLPEDIFGELIPARDLPDRLTVHAARQLADELGGETVTSAQYDSFAGAGLVATAGDDRLLPGDAVNQLVAAKRAVAYARPIARRTVFLRGYHPLFPVPADKLQQALIEFAPLVRQPAVKLTRVARWGRSAEARRLRPRRLPPVKEWRGLLASISPALVDAWATGWYAMAREFIPSYFAPAPSPLDDIPLEEQVLCLAILDIDRRSEVSLKGG
jgi:hypothetical protein